MADKISFSDFQKLDLPCRQAGIRVGTVVDTVMPEWTKVKKLRGKDIAAGF